MSPLRMFLISVVLTNISGLAAPATLEAHPFHTTTAEIEYNADSGRFEVSVKVLVADLEEALTRQAALEAKGKVSADRPHATLRGGSSQRVTLDKTPEVERQVVAYVKSHFFLTTTESDAAGSDRAGAPDEAQSREREIQTREHPGDEDVSAARRSSLQWTGMEIEKASAWLYFELEPPKSDKLSLANELFIEVNSQQINTCTLRAPATKVSLRTDARHPHVALPPLARLR